MARVFAEKDLFIVLCALLVGCGGANETADAADSGPPPDGADGSVEPATGDGVIVLTTTSDAPDVVVVSAAFRSEAPEKLPPLGDERCRLFDVGDASYVGDATAGDVTVRAGARDVALTLREAGRDKVYEAAPAAAFSPGEPVEVEATGGDVPAFRVGLDIARPVKLLTPLATGIAKDAAFDVTWEPSAEDQLVFVSLAGKSRYVSCVTRTPEGSVVISEDLVRAVAADPSSSADGAAVLQLRFSTATEAAVRAGAFEIRAQSSHDLAAPLALR